MEGLETPEPPPPRQFTDLELAELDLTAALAMVVAVLRREVPDLQPAPAAAAILDKLAEMLDAYMPQPAVTAALLNAFEARHPQPMNFIQLENAKKALGQMAADRRKAIAAATKIIRPGDL